MENLHQLLTDARGELPPPSPALDLDRITTRGRRQIRRRRWSVVAAAAAVTLAAGSLFPFVRGGHRPPAHPAPASSGAGFATRLTGYATGDYQVGASVMTTPGYETAPLTHAGRVVGAVEVYHPGAFDPRLFRTGTPVTIGTAPGFLRTATTTIKYGTDEKLATLTRTSLAWPYATDAWAVIRSAAEGPDDDLTPATLQQLATHFALAPAIPVRLPFRVGYAPPGLSAEAAGRVSLTFIRDPTLGRLGELTLAEPQQFTGLTGTITLTGVTVVEERQPAGAHHGATACDSFGCYKGLPGTDLYLGVTGKLPTAELRKVIDAVTTANPSDRTTWFPPRS